MRWPVLTVFCSFEAIPKVTIRPKGAIVRRRSSKALPPAISSTTSTISPPLASRISAWRSSLRESTATSAPSSRVRARFSSVEAIAMMFPAPIERAIWTQRLPVPPAAALTTTDSPGCMFAEIRRIASAVRPWISSPAAWSSSTPSGIGTSLDLRDRRHLGVGAAGDDRGDPLPVFGDPDQFLAGDERQHLLRQVVVAGRVGIGEVDAGPGDPDELLSRSRRRARGGRRGPSLRDRRIPLSEWLSRPNLRTLTVKSTPSL